MFNSETHQTINEWLAAADHDDNDWLFPSRKSGSRLLVSTITHLVKSWCAAINLVGNFGGSTMRKTFGYHQRVYFGLNTAILMVIYNHSSERQTLDYLGIEPDELVQTNWNVIRSEAIHECPAIVFRSSEAWFYELRKYIVVAGATA
ncbi:tyrosine-type recombinase/integrase [Oligoflexus sp.]|uniref:tyrosine-type recombinase/integrase n=1 Tax=Oligoflexus sp. TaxID=1971216 RepID=UPI0032C2193E